MKNITFNLRKALLLDKRNYEIRVFKVFPQRKKEP